MRRPAPRTEEPGGEDAREAATEVLRPSGTSFLGGERPTICPDRAFIKRKAQERILGSKIIPRRRPTLPRGLPRSTIGAGGLNCRVRNGNGCDSAAMATGNLLSTRENRSHE